MLFILCFKSQTQTLTYRLIRLTDLKRELVSNNNNVLKLYNICVDETRKLAYTSGIVTKYVSCINLLNKTETHTFTIPFTSQIHDLRCNPSNGYLILTTVQSTPVKSYLVRPDNGQLMGSVNHTSNPSGISFHRISNSIFISDGPEIKIYNGENFSFISSFNTMFESEGNDIDSVQSQIYVVSRNIISGNIQVKVFSINSPYNLIRTVNVPSSHNTGEIKLDPGRNRFYLIGLRNLKIVNLGSGTVLNQLNFSEDVSSATYNATEGIFYLTDDDGYSSNSHNGLWSKIYRYNTSTNSLDSFLMGDKASRLAYYHSGNSLLLPNMHSGLVQIYNTSTGSLDTVDVGESADDMTTGNGQLFIVSRLGGRRIIRQNIISGNLNTFRAGNSPCEIEFDATRNRIYVLNAFESSISCFNASDYSLISVLNLPVNQSRTDAIPWMHYDSQIAKLFITFPEFNKIIVVNCGTFTVNTSFSIPGFSFNENSHKAPGILQTVSSSNVNRLFVFQKNERKIKIFSTSTYNFIDSIDVYGLIPSDYGVFTANLLHFDNVSNTLFIGNRAIDPINYNIRGNVALGRRVIGYKTDRSLLYSIDVKGDSVFIYENHPVNYTLQNIRFLYKTENTIGSPVFSYDPAYNDLFITDYNYAQIRYYDMDSLNPIGIINNGSIIKRDFRIVRIFPNPFNPSFKISLKVTQNTNMFIKLYDISGKVVKTVFKENITAGDHSIDVHIKKELASGVYFCRVETDNFSETFKTIYIK